LDGKNPLPIIRRQPDPGLRLIDASILLETLLWSLETAPFRLASTYMTLKDQIERHAGLLRQPGAVLNALRVRNRRSHSRDPRQPSVSAYELDHAAAVILGAVDDLLPQISEDLRVVVTEDPHIPTESGTLDEISRMEDPWQRFRRLAAKLDSVLTEIDRDRGLPGYPPVAHAADRLEQRIERHAALFADNYRGQIIGAARAAASGDHMAPHGLTLLSGALTTQLTQLEYKLGRRPLPDSLTRFQPPKNARPLVRQPALSIHLL
jgi:hypothetical protein